ncbi:MAG TPA: energy transducer TonB, partial [Bacteroidales bacterium]|nr:energy transducer TonB [Bacteroidales bacterium]
KNIQFSNFFNYSLIQKRIKMITNSKTSKYSVHKLLMILPLAILITIGFSCAKEEPGSKDNTEISNNEIIPITKDATTNSDSESGNKNSADEEVFFIVEDMPTFQGKPVDNFRNYIADNIVYPEVAAKNGIEGKVFVQFKVTSTGKVADAKVVRGVDPALDAEALRVIKSSPDWEPGKQRGKKVCVMFTFPIKFELGK